MPKMGRRRSRRKRKQSLLATWSPCPSVRYRDRQLRGHANQTPIYAECYSSSSTETIFQPAVPLAKFSADDSQFGTLKQALQHQPRPMATRSIRYLAVPLRLLRLLKELDRMALYR
jgi:hypothetical protein